VAVDPSKLKKLGRRGLGLPPTDGSPGIEESAAKHAEALASDPQSQAGVASPEVEPTPDPAGLSSAPEPPVDWSGPGEPQVPPKERSGAAPEAETEEDAKARRMPSTTARTAGEQKSFQRGHRVPAAHVEPRIPFTTRITGSTKERLEDACYHLRRRHQDFINEAIAAHLEKHGF